MEADCGPPQSAGQSSLLSRPRRSDHSSSARPHRPESQSFNVKLSDLNLTEEHPVEVFRYQLKTEILKAKDFADEDSVLVPTYVATIVNPPSQKSLRIDVLDQCARKHRGAGPIQTARRLVV